MIHVRKLTRLVAVVAALSAAFAVNAAAAGIGTATVTSSSLRLRSEASTSSSVLTTLSNGASVAVLENSVNGWYKVSVGDTVGYVSGDYVTTEMIGSGAAVTGTVTASSLNVRAEASTESAQVGTLSSGDKVSITAISGDWYKISYNGGSAFVSAEYVALGDVNTASSQGEALTNYAKQFLGARYVYGATGPSAFDCSGFTSYVYKNFGYSLCHSSSGQYSYGTSVSKSNLQSGDLVFFSHSSSGRISHVGMYIGGGQFIHASTSSTGVIISDLNSKTYSSSYVGARRLLA